MDEELEMDESAYEMYHQAQTSESELDIKFQEVRINIGI